MWNTPMTFTVGQTVAAADLNTDVRDNTAFLYSPIMACAYRASDQVGIGDSTWTSVTFGASLYDTGLALGRAATIQGAAPSGSGSNLEQFQPQYAGAYMFMGGVQWDTNGAGNTRRLRAVNGGSGGILGINTIPSIASASQGLCTVDHFTSTSYAYMQVWHDSGSNRTLSTSGSDRSIFAALQWLGAGI